MNFKIDQIIKRNGKHYNTIPIGCYFRIQYILENRLWAELVYKTNNTTIYQVGQFYSITSFDCYDIIIKKPEYLS